MAGKLVLPILQWFRSGEKVSPVAMKSVQYSVVPTQPQPIVYICVAKNNAGNVSQSILASIIVNIVGNLQYVHNVGHIASGLLIVHMEQILYSYKSKLHGAD